VPVLEPVLESKFGELEKELGKELKGYEKEYERFLNKLKNFQQVLIGNKLINEEESVSNAATILKSLQFKLWSKGIYYKNDYNKVFKINKILAKVRTQDMISLNSGIRRHFHSQPFAMIDGGTSSEYNKNILSPWFVTGLSDGEASFTVTIYKDNTKKTGWRIQPSFSMELQGKDMLVLKNLQYFFGVGSIYERQKNKQGIYFIRSLEDLTNVIIPHFNKYHLLTKKYADFVLFKAIVELMNKKEHLTDEGVIKIISLRASMNKGLSEELLKNFSGITSVERSSLKFSDNIDPCWLAGFTSAEGCFYVQVVKSNTKVGYAVQLRFSLTQLPRDEFLFKKIREQLNCGNLHLKKDKKDPVVRFYVTRLSDINDIIIPLFDKYPIQGIKALDYKDFCQIASLMKNKAHLTEIGIKKIIEIKSKMNASRI
jgi:hypothetical protein